MFKLKQTKSFSQVQLLYLRHLGLMATNHFLPINTKIMLYRITCYAVLCIQKSISDVCWSPLDSRVFGCVSEGRIEIWNLEHSL